MDFLNREAHRPLVKLLASLSVASLVVRRYMLFVPW